MGKRSRLLTHIDATNAAAEIAWLESVAAAVATSGPSNATMLFDTLAAHVRRHFGEDNPEPFVIDISLTEKPNGDWHAEGSFGLASSWHQNISR